MKYLLLSFYIILSVFVAPLLGTTTNEVRPSDRDGAKKSLLLVEFQMNPYDPLARATDKVWNRVFQPIFKRLESIKSTAVPATFSSSTLAQPSQDTPSTVIVTPISAVPPAHSFSTQATTITPTSNLTTHNDASTIISTTEADISVSMNSTSTPSTTQLLNCIDWLLEWLQSNSSVPLRSTGHKDGDRGIAAN